MLPLATKPSGPRIRRASSWRWWRRTTGSPPRPEDGSDAVANWARERAALEWLESCDSPRMSWPEAFPRDVVKVFVPVNDTSVPPNPDRVKTDSLRAALGVIPDRRSRQERTFPSMRVGGAGSERLVMLQWSEAEPSPEILKALVGLAGKVTRIGHSSSLVSVSVVGGSDLSAPSRAAERDPSEVRR